MKIKKIAWLALVATSAFGSTQILRNACGGGDGPSPWAEQLSTSGVDYIHTRGGVAKDFIFWEYKNSLVYRSGNNQLIEYNMNYMKDRVLGAVNQPISHVTDPQERYILTHRNSWILDTFDRVPKWKEFSTTGEPIQQHLFWHFRSLFSLASTSSSQMTKKISINLYQSDSMKAKSCIMEANPGEEFHLAGGHNWPSVYLFKTAPSAKEPGKTDLTLIYLPVDQEMIDGQPCKFDTHKFQHAIWGNVTEVHFFTRNRVAIRTDHPKFSMMWWNGEVEACKYVPLGNRKVLVPNYSRHTFFTNDPNEGLRMYFPGEVEPAATTLRRDAVIRNQDDLWLNSSGQLLYVPVEKGGEGYIAEMNLKKVLASSDPN